MKRIKYRIFHSGEFYYWGFVLVPELDSRLHFSGVPTSRFLKMEEAQEASEKFLFIDKKGNDIYEGDIVEKRRAKSIWCISERWHGVVVKKHGRYLLRVFFFEYITMERQTRGGVHDLDLNLSQEGNYTYEVIGNIHQNADKMKEAIDHGWIL